MGQLQQSKIMKVISKKLVRKILELMKKLAKEEDTSEDEDEDENDEKKDKKTEESSWVKFYKEFAKNIKMGCYEDDSNRSKLSKLLRFLSTKSEQKEISFDKYLDGMTSQFGYSAQQEKIMKAQAFQNKDQ